MFFFLCVQEGLQEGPLGWEVTAQCGEASLVLWYSEEEEVESDPDQASMMILAAHVLTHLLASHNKLSCCHRISLTCSSSRCSA